MARISSLTVAIPIAMVLGMMPRLAVAQEASKRADIERQIRSQMAGNNLTDAQISSMVDEILAVSAKSVEENSQKENEKHNAKRDNTEENIPTKTTHVGRVSVRGELFRDATKSYIGKEKLANAADQSILDVLRREPGLIVQDDSVSIMGMPGNYTQVLVDGRRPPPTFSMKKLRPDEIDYIEVMFGAEADKASEGLAGSINIVLKRRVVKRNPVLQISFDGGGDSGLGIFASMNAVGANGNSFTANASVRRSWQNNGSGTEMSALTNRFGKERTIERSVTDADVSHGNIWLRWNRVLPDTSILSMSLTATDLKYSFISMSRYSELVGQLPGVGSVRNDSRTWSLTPSVKWSKALTDKLSFDAYATRSESNRSWNSVQSFIDSPAVAINHGDEGESRDSMDLGLVFLPQKETEFSAGVALDNTEWRYTDFTTGGDLGRPVGQTLNTFASRRDRAAYVKVVHSFNKRFGVNAGLRYTQWRVEPAHALHSLMYKKFRDEALSPSLNLTYRSNDDSRLTLNLARTFSPPAYSKLGTTSYPGLIDLNRPLYAWSIGNPDLRVETSDNVVISWEKKLTPRLDTTWRVSARAVSGAIAEVIRENGSGWYSQAINLPDAGVVAISGSIKYVTPLKLPSGTFTLSQTLIRSSSKIEGIDSSLGLPGETPLNAVLGADWNLVKVTAGLDLNYQKRSTSYGGPFIRTVRPSSVQANARLSWLATDELTVSASIVGPLRRKYENNKYYFNEENGESMSLLNVTDMPMMVNLTLRYQF